MRIVVLIVLAALAASPSHAQPPGPGLKTGQMEIKAFQPIPKTKTAVQLTSDTSLARKLRGEVMERLARRGNQVGFSGGNVMRMDVSYFDLSGGSGRGGYINDSPSYLEPGSNPRMDLPRNKLERRDTYTPPATGPTLRISLTLYSVETGKVLWFANASCITQGNNAEQSGINMIDAIFADADKNRIADAGCPL
jgi:hypothetical protein